LRSLGQRELCVADVGPRPEHSWRDEFVEFRLAVAHAERARDPDSPLPTERFEYEPGGELHFEAARDTFLTPTIAKKVAKGWTVDEALLDESLLDESQGAVLHRKNRQFPAIVHAFTELYSELGRRTDQVPEVRYKVLEGRTGAQDAAWTTEALRRLGVGGRFVSSTAVVGFDGAIHLGRAAGYVELNTSCTGFEVMGGDVVCIRSAPKDRGGMHALVRSPCDDVTFYGTAPRRSTRLSGALLAFDLEDAWCAPPGTHVTIDSIAPPGSWRAYANGPLVQKFLFTVSISFG